MATRTMKKSFKMIASVGGSGSPNIIFLPAIPFRIGSPSSKLRYGVLDTSAPISTISSDFLEADDWEMGKQKKHYAQKTKSKIYFRVIICDPGGDPWVDIWDVPFIVQERPTSSLILGIDSFLERLHVDFEFNKKLVTVASSAAFRFGESSSSSPEFPEQIEKAEALVTYGETEAALVMALAAVEHSLLAHAHRTRGFTEKPKLTRPRLFSNRENNLKYLYSYLDFLSSAAEVSRANEFTEARTLLSELVHSPIAKGQVSENTASRAIETAKQLITAIDESSKRADVKQELTVSSEA